MNYKISIIFLAICSLFLSQNVLAANLSVNLDSKNIKQNEFFSARIVLNTESESLNAMEGDLFYDTNLDLVNINIGNSIVNFWVEEPKVGSKGQIHFSGIIPGGVSVESGELFQVVFRGSKIGNYDFSFKNINFLLNDGEGTRAKVKTENNFVKVLKGGADINKNYVIEDKISPEEFKFVRTRDVNLYDNKYFIVFSTQDKGSGIARYEVCEFFYCKEAVNPYEIRNQTPFYYIKVKAYDLNGNTRSSTLTSPYLINGVFLLLLPFLYFSYRYLNRHRV